MTDTRTVPAPVSNALADGPRAPWLEVDRLDCYRVAVEFLTLVPRLGPARGSADLREQLGRASASIALNDAEGAGHVAKLDRARFFAIARGSATECGRRPRHSSCPPAGPLRRNAVPPVRSSSESFELTKLVARHTP